MYYGISIGSGWLAWDVFENQVRCVAPLQCNDGGNKLVVAPPEVGSLYILVYFWHFRLTTVLGLTVNTFPISWGWSSPGDHLGRVHLHGGWVDQRWRSKAIKSNLLPLWFIVLCVHHNGDECESSGIVEFPQTGKSPTTIWVETNFLPSVLLGWTGFRTPPAFPSAGGSRNVDFFFPFFYFVPLDILDIGPRSGRKALNGSAWQSSLKSK